MQHALAHRANVGSSVIHPRSRASAVRCRAAATAVKTPEKFIPPWRDCFAVLQQKGLRTVSPDEAKKLMDSGKWVLLDVRCAWACVSGCFV